MGPCSGPWYRLGPHGSLVMPWYSSSLSEGTKAGQLPGVEGEPGPTLLAAASGSPDDFGGGAEYLPSKCRALLRGVEGSQGSYVSEPEAFGIGPISSGGDLNLQVFGVVRSPHLTGGGLTSGGLPHSHML